jgi:hypothetical protein
MVQSITDCGSCVKTPPLNLDLQAQLPSSQQYAISSFRPLIGYYFHANTLQKSITFGSVRPFIPLISVEFGIVDSVRWRNRSGSHSHLKSRLRLVQILLYGGCVILTKSRVQLRKTIAVRPICFGCRPNFTGKMTYKFSWRHLISKTSMPSSPVCMNRFYRGCLVRHQERFASAIQDLNPKHPWIQYEFRHMTLIFISLIRLLILSFH